MPGTYDAWRMAHLEGVLNGAFLWIAALVLPLVPIGIVGTRRLAWGVTYFKGDTCDYFIEDCRKEKGAWQYRRGSQWSDFDVREEIIERKGSEPETLHVHFNDLGTLDCDPDADGPGYYLLSKWTGDGEGAARSLTTWLGLVHCGDTLSAMAKVRELPQPTLCWVFADGDGHIGKQVSGWFPLRSEGRSVVDIRSREIRGRSLEGTRLRSVETRYDTSVGEERFLEITTEDDRLVAFLRLLLPRDASFVPELGRSALIRELHVYGASLSLGRRAEGVAQHAGLGRKLIEAASKGAAAAGYARLAVISAIGTRGYYRGLGFEDGPLYQHRDLVADHSQAAD